MALYLMRAVLMGPPNSGKGVAGEFLAQNAGVNCVSTGQLLRAEVAAGTETGDKLKAELEKGRFAPDSVVEGLVVEFLKQNDSFALDGFPRNIPQADFLERELTRLAKPLNIVILMNAPDEAVIERAITRLTCRDCRRVTSTRHTSSLTCSFCGGQLYRRPDDTEETVKERLAIYREQTEPLVAYYTARGLLETIDAGGTIPQVHAELRRVIERFDVAKAAVG